ncbi:Acetylcholine receptor-like protein cup-4 [Dirofilaria immitis]|nr:Acetylcholine receptor-like protein cup-4 [Dirofilaria immitis]
MASMLKFLYLLFLPTFSEQIRTIQKMVESEKILLKKIFKKENYDYSLPSESPTIVLPFMFIDHVEQLHWTDKRIVWEPRDYGNVDKIVRQKVIYQECGSLPSILLKFKKLRSDQAMQYFNTEVTLISNGAVYAQVVLTIRSTCSLDFTGYPNDIQSCLLTMFTPLPLSRLKFSRWTSLTHKLDTFGSLMNESRTIRSGEFEITNLSASLLFILPFGKITVNESAITFMVGTVVSAPNSIVWLLLCFAAQILNYMQMLNKLPPDQQNTPLCAKMAKIMLAETMVLIIYRAAITYKYSCSINGKEIFKCSRMQKIEITLRILLTLHIFLNAVLLFY